MTPKDILDSLKSQLQEYCTPSESDTPKEPFVFFLPPMENFQLQTWVTENLSSTLVDQWLVFSTYGTFNNKQAFFPILQVIREMLFIEEDIVAQNASLPEEERLPQVGDYLIPDFLQEVPQIEQLYGLMAEVSSEEERIQMFTQAAEIVTEGLQQMEKKSPPVLKSSQFFFQPHQNSGNSFTKQDNVYETLLQVFQRMIADLFQMKGMIFLFNHFSLQDDISFKWLQYSACFPFEQAIPLFILVQTATQEDYEQLMEKVMHWPKKARFFIEAPEKNLDVEASSEPPPSSEPPTPSESSKPSDSFSNSPKSGEKDPQPETAAHRLMQGARQIYQYMKENRLMHPRFFS